MKVTYEYRGRRSLEAARGILDNVVGVSPTKRKRLERLFATRGKTPVARFTIDADAWARGAGMALVNERIPLTAAQVAAMKHWMWHDRRNIYPPFKSILARIGRESSKGTFILVNGKRKYI